MRKLLMTKPEYPVWICGKCGVKYGKKPCGTATWHSDTCGVCGNWRSVTEPRDFGHLKDGWEKEKQNES